MCQTSIVRFKEPNCGWEQKLEAVQTTDQAQHQNPNWTKGPAVLANKNLPNLPPLGIAGLRWIFSWPYV
jgi:hypothetical protein